jgi:integrase
MEAMRLRVKDLDFGQGTITIHDGKNGKHTYSNPEPTSAPSKASWDTPVSKPR